MSDSVQDVVDVPRVDMEKARVLFEFISRTGINVDLSGLIAKIQELQAKELIACNELDELTEFPILKVEHKDLIKPADIRFNPRSRNHINAWLTEHGEPTVKSVSEQNLEPVVPPDIFEKIMEARRQRRFADDLNKLRERIAPDGRIHVQWTVAAHGRWYTGKPPIQTLAKVCREFLIPDPGNNLLILDWRQQELRILAHLSKDPGLLKAFQQGGDPHSAAFESVTGIPISKDDRQLFSEQRDIGKMLNYALIYGLDAQGLGTKLRISNQHAQQLIDKYFQAYPVLAEWRQHQKELVEKTGQVITLGGRRIEIEPDRDPEKTARKAVNYLCSGSAADQLVIALQRIYDDPPMIDYIRCSIHDAFLIELPPDDPDNALERIHQHMHQKTFGIESPVDIKGPAKTWREAMEQIEE